MATRQEYNRQRFLECVPAVLLAGGVLLPVVLLLFSPALAYVALAGFVIAWSLRSVSMALRQAYEALKMRRFRRIDWSARLAALTDPYGRLTELTARPRLSRSEREEHAALLEWVHAGPEVPSPDELYHLVVMPVANEHASIITETLDALAASEFPLERILVCLTFEARSSQWSPGRIAEVVEPYENRFGMVLTTQHPDGLEGEGRVKGANITWGAKVAREELQRRGLRDEQVVVSAFDCDTRPSPQYFGVLAYTYLTNPTRDVDSYQPILLFHNNVWDVSAASRLVGYVASMWTMVDSTQPRRLRLFSSHAIGMHALHKVGYWATNVIPDDSRQYWRMYFASNGRARTQPLHAPVFLDAVQAGDLFSTLVEQYKQIRRWAYGVTDFPYVMTQSLSDTRIPAQAKLIQTFRQLGQFHQWALTPILLVVTRAFLGLIVPYAQSPEFNLVDVAQFAFAYIPQITLGSLAVSIVVALALLPHRPAGSSPLIYVKLAAEWILLPVVAPLFLCLPAIDAQVRMAVRRYLGFRVTVKARTAQAAELR